MRPTTVHDTVTGCCNAQIQTSSSSTNTTVSTLLSTAEVVQSVSFTQLGSDFANAGLFSAFSMSGDGTMIALGNSVDDTGLTDSGQVKCYQYSSVSKSWVLCGTIQGTVASGLFGWCVSLSYDGFSLACSSKGEVNGRISLFNYSNSTWTKLAEKVGTNTTTGQTGRDVKISGNGTVLISGFFNNPAAGAGLGMAQV